jgi:hypothetical protein
MVPIAIGIGRGGCFQKNEAFISFFLKTLRLYFPALQCQKHGCVYHKTLPSGRQVRKKLKKDESVQIINVRGYGYKLVY